jgi:hypothetical protein
MSILWQALEITARIVPAKPQCSFWGKPLLDRKKTASTYINESLEAVAVFARGEQQIPVYFISRFKGSVVILEGFPVPQGLVFVEQKLIL